MTKMAEISTFGISLTGSMAMEFGVAFLKDW